MTARADKAPKARVRPVPMMRAAIREAMALGAAVEIQPDGTILIRPPSPQSTERPVAKPKGVVL